MKYYRLLCRALAAGSVAFFVGAFLWLWETVPYVDDWYSRLARPSWVESVIFKIYIVDWGIVAFVVMSAWVVFRRLTFDRYRGAELALVSLLSLGGGFMFLLAGNLLRRFLSVPAYGWTPPPPHWLTIVFNIGSIVIVVLSEFVCANQRNSRANEI
jgi:hypothetical protein